ncbi:MAG: bifunctional nuclease family protein [Planctomycetes bacterium]|nr:bifunctional nuclease family protein [Planctomycetota bacterium]
MIEMALSRVVLQDARDQQFIFLKEKQGHRSFPIVIGLFEANEIWRAAQNKRTPRPFTHELMARSWNALDAYLRHVVVNDLRDNTFYARLVIDQAGREVEIDARPSDAIAMATRLQAPIFVEEHVIDQVLSE